MQVSGDFPGGGEEEVSNGLVDTLLDQQEQEFVMIRIKIMSWWVLVALNVAALVWCVLEFGTAGLAIWTFLGAAQMYVWASQGGDTPEKKRKRETAFVRSDGQIVWRGKRVSLRDARKRGLKLEYEDESKKKIDYWKGR